MNSESKSPAPGSRELQFVSQIMALTASLAEDIAEKWPFMAAHLRLDIFGSAGHTRLHAAMGQAVTLGLSGIVDAAADGRKVAGALALQQRMMAVRLAGRKLVAFHPDRDLKFIPAQRGGIVDRIRVSVWSTEGKLLGRADRLIHPGRQGEQIPAKACA